VTGPIRRSLAVILIVICVLSCCAACSIATDAAATSSLQSLREIYLSMHQGCWADCTPSDPRRQTRLWEQFPGRCTLAYQVDLQVQERVLRLIRDAREDEGILIVPNGLKKRAGKNNDRASQKEI
jgi:hypothetical protein